MFPYIDLKEGLFEEVTSELSKDDKDQLCAFEERTFQTDMSCKGPNARKV
jgi:hypothetical protein